MDDRLRVPSQAFAFLVGSECLSAGPSLLREAQSLSASDDNLSGLCGLNEYAASKRIVGTTTTLTPE